MTAFFRSIDSSDDTYPTVSDFAANEAQHFVPFGIDRLSDLSDADLQAYICACAERFVAAHRRYEVSGDFADAGDRDRWWLKEAEALVERGNRKGAH